MRILLRLVALVCFVVVLGQAVALHRATGGGLFTQVPSRNLASMQEAKPHEDPFAGLGMNDLKGEPVKVDNAFRLGWLPGGNGLADSASMATFAGPALILLGVTWFLTRRPAARSQRSE